MLLEEALPKKALEWDVAYLVGGGFSWVHFVGSELLSRPESGRFWSSDGKALLLEMGRLIGEDWLSSGEVPGRPRRSSVASKLRSFSNAMCIFFFLWNGFVFIFVFLMDFLGKQTESAEESEWKVGRGEMECVGSNNTQTYFIEGD